MYIMLPVPEKVKVKNNSITIEGNYKNYPQNNHLLKK